MATSAEPLAATKENESARSHATPAAPIAAAGEHDSLGSFGSLFSGSPADPPVDSAARFVAGIDGALGVTALRGAQQNYGNQFVQRLVATVQRLCSRPGPERPTVQFSVDKPAAPAADQTREGYFAGLYSTALDPVLAEPTRALDTPNAIHEAAARGTSGPGGSLPFFDRIQSSFGSHDISGIQAHQDWSAQQGAAAMGAEAFASGDHVAFAGTPTLRVAAHEAAHVVQQRSGVHLLGGVGQPGDAYEQNAEQVADRVVQGQSSEELLNKFAEPPTAPENDHQKTRKSIQQQKIQLAPGDAPAEKKVGFKIAFDKPLTRDQFIDLTVMTIYGRRVNLVWTGVKDKYSPVNSPIWAYVPVSTLQGRLKDYGEDAAKVVQGIDTVQDAATYQRLNKILQKLTPAQWADFEKKVTAKTSSLDEFEKAVDAYLAEQQQHEAEQKKREDLEIRLYGLEDLYKQYKDWKLYIDLWGTAPPKVEQSLVDKLARNGFTGGIPEFEKFIDDYLIAFRTETIRIGFDLLEKYDSVLYKEAVRYQDAGVVAAMHQKLGILRTEFPLFEKSAKIYNDYVRDEPQSHLPGSGGILKSTKEEAMAAKADAEKHKAAAQQSVVDISGEFPILKEDHLPLDRRLDKAAIAKADPGQLQSLLQSHIQARRDDVKKSKETLRDDPEKAFSLDNLIKLSLERQAIDPKSIFGQIIQDKISQIKIKELIIGFLIAVIAIALAIVSAGTGVVAAGAAVTAFGLSAFTAYQEFREYETKQAAYGAGLLSDEPSLFWVIVSVVAAGVDLALAVKAVKAVSPLAKAMKASGDLAKFNEGLKALEKAGEIDAKIARNLEQAAATQAKSLEAAEDLTKALGKVYSFPGPFTDPDVYKQLVKLAFYKVKQAGLAFEKFVLEIKEARQAAKLGDLTTEELAKLKQAYEEGRKFASEEELLKFMKQTHPMNPADATRLPGGKRTIIGAKDDPETTRSLQRENDAADILSQKGYNVEQNPATPGPSNPDYKIEGKIFDCYAPTEKKTPRGIWSYIKEEKLDKGQTTRVVLNLQDWGGDLAALKKQFADWPMAGLDEVIVILKDKSIIHLVP